MKIKLDENLPNELVDLLAGHQHDVDTVPAEALAGRDDSTVFAAARNNDRLLIRQDLDFSDVRKFRPGTHPRIVLIRLRHPSRQNLVERIAQLLSTDSFDSWGRCFVVITIARDEDSPLPAREAEQLGVLCLRQAESCNGNNLVPQPVKELDGVRIDILISQKLHGTVAR